MARPRRQPERTCVGCRSRAAKGGLLRVVRGPDGSVTVDSTGHAPGRGAYLHATEACVRLARRNRAVERALRLEGKEAARLMEELALPSGDAR